MQMCAALWVADSQTADGITSKPACALVCVSAADKCLYSLFSCSDSENEINRQAVSLCSLFQAVLNPILFASLRGGIWMTWSISNQERPAAFLSL